MDYEVCWKCAKIYEDVDCKPWCQDCIRSNVFISLDQLVVDEEKYDKTYNEKS